MVTIQQSFSAVTNPVTTVNEQFLIYPLPILSTSPFNLARFDFVARFDVSTPAAPFESGFVE